MLNRRPVLVFVLLFVLGAFGYGLVQLFKLRFATGDIYPPYSSLRGDPLGSRVYVDRLQQLDCGLHACEQLFPLRFRAFIRRFGEGGVHRSSVRNARRGRNILATAGDTHELVRR